MGHMAKKVLSRAGNILVFLPLAHAIATILYFTFLAGEIRLSDVFPWLFWSCFPAVLAALFFMVRSIIHLLSKDPRNGKAARVFWVLSFFLFTAISLPVYRFTWMKANPSRTHP